MYLNIEPDGKSHVVVFYNSNPSGKFKFSYCIYDFKIFYLT